MTTEKPPICDNKIYWLREDGAIVSIDSESICIEFGRTNDAVWDANTYVLPEEWDWVDD